MRSVESREGHLLPVASQEAEYGNIGGNLAEIDSYRPQHYRRSEPPAEIYLPTFDDKKGMIVLPKPTEKQLALFWSRLEQLGSITVIDLASDDIELKHLLIDRNNRDHATKGPYVLKEANNNGFVDKTYSMTQETCRNKTITHFVLSSWKGVDIPTDRKSLLEMIEAVHTWQPEMTDDTPIVILDNGGFQKCGIVAVLLNEIYRILQQNGRINILQSVKKMVYGKSLLIRSKMQFKFCYDVM
ncbi:uncharacterized protein LOC127837968 [Dreissena polymorpha]|uniref:Tyrosine-protein phosphatase domain-containing protein n=1 Tax=Dreissena polymorpha TaxID=45954 RepID=A0A9D4FNK5_DREPO|nr:uncharacterized protein LOC127837968 [Dreissena polymorpha]KAH3802120.1 hypothetical protein DPMN_155789 [Dreissena polymorpha]